MSVQIYRSNFKLAFSNFEFAGAGIIIMQENSHPFIHFAEVIVMLCAKYPFILIFFSLLISNSRSSIFWS
jgi:hypothetical protein